MRAFSTDLLRFMRRKRLLKRLDGSGEKTMDTALYLTEEGTIKRRGINTR